MDPERSRQKRLEQVLAQPESARILGYLAEHGRVTERQLADALSLEITSLRDSLQRLQRYNLVMEVTAREQLRLNIDPPQTRFCLGSSVPAGYLPRGAREGD